jgi:hypothetical protein
MGNYDELDGSPVEEWLPNEFSATRKLICAWGDRNAIIEAAGADGGEVYPHNPGTKAYAYAASAEPFGGQAGGGDGMSSYEKAIVTIKYTNASNKPYRTSDGKYVTEQITPTAEYLQTSAKNLYWDSGHKQPLAEGEAPPFFYRSFTYTITFHHASAVPGGILGLVNCVNGGPMASYSLGFVFAAETLLFPAASAVRTIQLGKLNDWQITYHFAYKSVGWNSFWRNDPPGFSPIYPKGSTQPYRQHPLANFMSLVPS